MHKIFHRNQTHYNKRRGNDNIESTKMQRSASLDSAHETNGRFKKQVSGPSLCFDVNVPILEVEEPERETYV